MCLWPIQHWVLRFGPWSSWDTLARGCSVDGHSEEASRGNHIRMLLESIPSRSMAWRESQTQGIGSRGLCACRVCYFLFPNQRDQEASSKSSSGLLTRRQSGELEWPSQVSIHVERGVWYFQSSSGVPGRPPSSPSGPHWWWGGRGLLRSQFQCMLLRLHGHFNVFFSPWMIWSSSWVFTLHTG